jgi:2-aminophenol/2-amino-5-chlorophenol 1,6-dioxygenase subunit alpha
MENLVLKGYLLPGLPHILLAPDKNPGWKKVRQAFDKVRAEIEELKPDILVIYSTYWPSVIGHQVQAYPNPEWVHVDEEFHELGSIPYKMKVDAEFAKTYVEKAKARGLHARTVAYKGFPIDTGAVVVSKLVNPDAKIPCVIVSSNVYSDRAETLVLGKAARDAVEASGKKAVAIVVSSLSNRLHTEWIDPKDDKISSLKDQEWNSKFLEFFKDGKLEDISQLSRQFHKEARVSKVANFKPFWWLASFMGQNNLYAGDVIEYQPIYGTGAAVVGLTPSLRAARDLEFDESDPDKYLGERNVLDQSNQTPELMPNIRPNIENEEDVFGREPR